MSPLTHLDAQATELTTFAANLERLAAQRNARLQVPFSPLTMDEIRDRQDGALVDAGLAMVCAHKYPHDRDHHVDRGAEPVADYLAWQAATIRRYELLRDSR